MTMKCPIRCLLNLLICRRPYFIESDVEPFEKEEFESFVNAQLMVTGPTLERLFQMSRGHPLSLKLALQEFALSGQLSFSHLGYQLEDVSNVDLSDGLRERWLAPLMLKSDQFPDLVLSLEIAAVLGAEFNLIEWLDV